MAVIDDLPLIPVEEPTVDAVLAIDAAEASLLEAADGPADPDGDEAQPLGRGAVFDFDRGRFVRAGAGPAYASGDETLAQWAMATIRTAQGAHHAHSSTYGMVDPEGPIGKAADVGEAVADWMEHAREALLQHDRVGDVLDLQAQYVPEAQGVLVDPFVLVLDGDDEDDVTVSGGLVATGD